MIEPKWMYIFIIVLFENREKVKRDRCMEVYKSSCGRSVSKS